MCEQENRSSVHELNPCSPVWSSQLVGERDGHDSSVTRIFAAQSITSLQPCASICVLPATSGDSTKAILQMKTLRCTEVKPSAQGHTASE